MFGDAVEEPGHGRGCRVVALIYEVYDQSDCVLPCNKMNEKESHGEHDSVHFFADVVIGQISATGGRCKQQIEERQPLSCAKNRNSSVAVQWNERVEC